MAEIKLTEIEKLSRLSRIALNDEAKSQLAKQVGQIIEWVDDLAELSTETIEPMNNPNDSNLRLEKDLVSDGGISGEILKNAPKSVYGYFAVPKVIE